jgi:cobalt/nickel transport system permease protein
MSEVAAHEHCAAHAPAPPLDVRAQVLIFFSLIITGVSTPPQAGFAFAAYFLFVASSLILFRIPVLLFIKRASVAIPFVLMIAVFVPFLKRETGDTLYPVLGGLLHVSRSGLWVLGNTALKGSLGVACLVILGAANPFQRVLAALQWYRAPKVLVQLAGFMYRYLFVIAEEFQRMVRARDARGFQGRWIWQSRIIGQMIATLFLRSYERAERIYAAMVSRGFDGQFPESELPPPSIAHFVIAGVCMASFLAVRLWLA